eukprot:8305803-Alexandrium_andersonii.AAC.1
MSVAQAPALVPTPTTSTCTCPCHLPFTRACTQPLIAFVLVLPTSTCTCACPVLVLATPGCALTLSLPLASPIRSLLATQ